MVRYENECVGPCPQGCIGSSCRYRNVPYFYCDECGAETESLYSDGYECLCRECAKKAMLEIVNDFSFNELCEATGFSEVEDFE